MLGFQSSLPTEYQEGWRLCFPPSLKVPTIFFATFVDGGSVNLRLRCRLLAGYPALPPEGKGPSAGFRLSHSGSGIPEATRCHRLFQGVCVDYPSVF